MKKKSFVIMIIAALCAGQGWAILGVGDIVFDPSNYEEAIQHLIQLQQQYQQLVQTYLMIRNQYDQMLRMAQQVPVDMVQRYRALATPWTSMTAANTLWHVRWVDDQHQLRVERLWGICECDPTPERLWRGHGQSSRGSAGPR
jgi:conjugal transfer/entry exclusion protein